MHRKRDAKSTLSVATKVLMRLGVKVKVLIEPPNILITGCSRSARGILAWDPANIPGHTCDTPAEPILLAANAATGWVQNPHRSIIITRCTAPYHYPN